MGSASAASSKVDASRWSSSEEPTHHLLRKRTRYEHHRGYDPLLPVVAQRRRGNWSSTTRSPCGSSPEESPPAGGPRRASSRFSASFSYVDRGAWEQRDLSLSFSNHLDCRLRPELSRLDRASWPDVRRFTRRRGVPSLGPGADAARPTIACRTRSRGCRSTSGFYALGYEFSDSLVGEPTAS